MLKNLIYCDAENLTYEQFDEFKKGYNAGGAITVGKFYGNRNAIGDVTEVYLRNGFEYVDTKLTETTKNVTDMKLVVDCITDCVMLFNSIQSVYILSSDRDFIPLAHKLTGMGIRVEFPFVEVGYHKCDCKDINKFLESSVFKFSDYPELMFGDVKEAYNSILREEFDSELINLYVAKKKRKFAREIGKIYNEKAAKAVEESDKFDFYEVQKLVGVENTMELLNCFTSKVFGVFVPQEFTLQNLK